MHQLSASISCSFFLLFASAATAQSASEASTVFTIVDGDAQTAQPTGVAVRAGRNEYVVAWADHETDRVFVQRVDTADETAAGEPIVVSDEPGVAWSWVSGPAVAYSPSSDRYLVTWRGGNASIGDRIIVRMLDAQTLAPVGEHFHLNDIAGGIYPQVAWNAAAQEFIVVWVNQKYRPYLYRPRITAQRVSATGERVGSNIVVHDFDGQLSVEPCEMPARVVGSANGYLVAWADQNEQYGAKRIFARRLDLGGQALGEAFPIYTREPASRFLCNLDLVHHESSNTSFAAFEEWYWNNEDERLTLVRIGSDESAVIPFAGTTPTAGNGRHEMIGNPHLEALPDGDRLALLWMRDEVQWKGFERYSSTLLLQTFDAGTTEIGDTPESVLVEEYSPRAALGVGGDAGGKLLLAWKASDAPHIAGQVLTIAAPAGDGCDEPLVVPPPNSTTALWIDARKDCRSNTIRVHVGNLGDVALSDMRLSLRAHGGATDHTYFTAHCEWQDNACALGDFASHEVHVLTIYPSVDLADLRGTLEFIVSASAESGFLEVDDRIVLGESPPDMPNPLPVTPAPETPVPAEPVITPEPERAEALPPPMVAPVVPASPEQSPALPASSPAADAVLPAAEETEQGGGAAVWASLLLAGAFRRNRRSC